MTDLRLSRLDLETVLQASPDLRLSRIAFEVVIEEATPPSGGDNRMDGDRAIRKPPRY